MRVIGLDIHRSFAQVAMIENQQVHDLGRIELEHSKLVAFGKKLRLDDEVVVEATATGVRLSEY